MKNKRQYYNVTYKINYPSGKKWIGSRRALALSGQGAGAVVKWLYAPKDIEILYVSPTYEYIGAEIYPDHGIIGDF